MSEKPQLCCLWLCSPAGAASPQALRSPISQLAHRSGTASTDSTYGARCATGGFLHSTHAWSVHPEAVQGVSGDANIVSRLGGRTAEPMASTAAHFKLKAVDCGLWSVACTTNCLSLFGKNMPTANSCATPGGRSSQNSKLQTISDLKPSPFKNDLPGSW